MHTKLQHQSIPGSMSVNANTSAKNVAKQHLPSHANNDHAYNFGNLAISPPGNVYEREAEAMADKVVNLSHHNTVEKANDSNAGLAVPSLSAMHSTLQSQGSPLDATTRSYMENRFGHNFNNIKIHDNLSANKSAKDINALAYTYRNNIVFAKDQYKPQTTGGKKLLAHELTHTIQQGSDLSGESNGAVQRFASEEHQQLGNVATGKATYNLGSAADKFELTHGDIVALSGDVFMPEELFKLAATPSTDKGKKKGTRDEVIWALQDTRIWEMRAEKKGANPFAQQQDPRFKGSGPFAGYAFSEDVKAAVFEKYQKLGAANASHFVAPIGRDKSGAPIASAESAGSKYVKYHEDAIHTADQAGRGGTPVDMAMANDAGAQHYLTDSFSAGHLRTPIESIREYWGNKYPLFWYNLRHKIALDTAIEMVKGSVITNHFAYTQILGNVETMATTLPAVTLGDLVGSIYHDVDNESGVNIKGGGKVFGDKNLDTATEKLAVNAIKASNNDITQAHNHGKTTTTPVPDKDLFDSVRKAGGGSGKKYAAELLIPEPDPKEPSQNWKASDIHKLWSQKFLGKKGDTVGDVISKRVQGGSIAIQLTALADRFPTTAALGLQPRAAYLTGFVKKLQNDPKAGVLDIVNWMPHDMWTGDAEGDVIKDLKSKGAAGNKTENLSGMSDEQKVRFAKEFISDGKPGWFLPGNPSAYDNLILMFEGLTAAERKKLYREIEGRSWNGSINDGDQFDFKIRTQVKGKDKDIMDKTRVAQFKKIMKAK